MKKFIVIFIIVLFAGSFGCGVGIKSSKKYIWGKNDPEGTIVLAIHTPVFDIEQNCYRIEYAFKNTDSKRHRYGIQVFLVGKGVKYTSLDIDQENSTDFIKDHKVLLKSGGSRYGCFYIDANVAQGKYRIECKYYDERFDRFREGFSPYVTISK